MAKKSSFDIVADMDMQEVDNAVNNALKEIKQRYDLKDSKTEIELNKKDKVLTLHTKDDYSRKQSIDILQSKFLKRKLSIKALKYEEVESASNGTVRQKIILQCGISKDNAKKITKMVKEMKIKVQTQIMDEKIRVQGAKRDDLQAVIKAVNDADFDFPTQFTNYQ